MKLTTPLIETAKEICLKAHAGQTDKSGVPYYTHPFHLAEQMDTQEEICVALLHDVMEDTTWTAEQLRQAGMTEPVMAALLLLCHDKAVPYMDYVRAIKENPLARKVKQADLRHNSDLSRLASVTEKDLLRVEKYKQAMAILDE